MQSLNIGKNNRILIIAPHPDDECIGTGGILLRHASQCDVIVLTDGRQGQGDISPEEGRIVRKQEFHNEMNRLEIQRFKMLDIEDGMLIAHTDCLIREELQDYDKIFVTGMNDEHPDHKAALLCLKNWTKNHSGNRMPECFAYEVHTPLQNPTHFMDITDIIKDKQELIRFHQSQLRDLPYDILADQCASYRATLYRMPLRKIEVYQKINLTDDSDEEITETELRLQKERVNGWVLKRWIQKTTEGQNIAQIINDKGINEVYIYGYGEIGRLLCRELSQSDVSVRAVLDRRAEQFSSEEHSFLRAEQVSDKLPVIVTAIYEYEKIRTDLEDLGFDRVLSLKNMLEEA